jgi:hypothetical protein
LTAADAVRASADYKTKLADAIANGADNFKLTISLESAFGKNYKSQVEGVRKNGSSKNPQGYSLVDFEGGTISAMIKFYKSGTPFIYTMYAVP